MTLRAIANSDVYVIGGGRDKKLPITSNTPATVFQPFIDKAEEVSAAISAIIAESDPFFRNLNELVGSEPTSLDYPDSRISGEWLVSSVEELSNHSLLSFLPLTDVTRLNDFPYLLASGNYVTLQGSASVEWAGGSSSLYNKTMGLVYQVNDEFDTWYISLRKVTIPATPQRAEENPSLTAEQLALSTPYYHTGTTRLVDSSPVGLESVLSSITRNRQDIYRLDKEVQKLNWRQQRLAGLLFMDWSAMLAGRLSSFFPSELFGKASSLFNSLNTIKNSTLCFLECTINTAVEIGDSILSAIGSIRDGGILSSVKIGMPDIETLSNCFNLKWLLGLLMGFLGKLLGMLKSLWGMLKSLLSWPDCSCSGGGLGLPDFGFDVCGFGVKIDKQPSAEAEGVGTLDLLRSYVPDAALELFDGEPELKPKLEWDVGTLA